MTETRDFHLGDILSITTGKLLSPRRIEGVYDILNWMTDSDLFTHQLPRAAEAARPALLSAFPDLDGLDTSAINEHTYRDWLVEAIERFGEYRPVPKCPDGTYQRRGPIEELSEMSGPKSVLIVKT